jgi:hypothetical protein
MKKHNLEKEPFPTLVNKLMKDLNCSFKQRIPFCLPQKDNNNQNVIKDDKIVYTPNIKLSSYFNQIQKESNIQAPPLRLEPGIKHSDFLAINKDAAYLPRICLSAKNTLVNLCKQNNIDENIINLVFDDFMFDKNGNIRENYEKKIYNWLTTHEVKKIDCRKDNENNNNHDKSIFVESRHHDREQIHFSPTPNSNPQNIILTLPLNSKLNAKSILNTFIEHLQNTRCDDKKLMLALDKEAKKIKDLPNKELINIHSTILHNGNFSIENQSTPGFIDHFYISPTQPQNEEKSSKSEDTHIVALTDTTSKILNKTGKKELTTKEKETLRAEQFKALKTLREKEK